MSKIRENIKNLIMILQKIKSLLKKNPFIKRNIFDEKRKQKKSFFFEIPLQLNSLKTKYLRAIINNCKPRKKLFSKERIFTGVFFFCCTVSVFAFSKSNTHIIPSASLTDISFEKEENILVEAIVLPERSATRESILRDLSKMSNQEEQTIVYIKPMPIEDEEIFLKTSLWDWETDYGILKADTKNIERLLSLPFILEEDTPLTEEEYISFNIFHSLKRNFPNSEIIPLFLDKNLELEEGKVLAETLHQYLKREDILFVVEIDTKNEYISRFHQINIENIFRHQKEKNISLLPNKSQGVSQFFLAFLNLRQVDTFVELTIEPGDFEVEMPDGEIFGYYTKEKVSSGYPITMVSFGDMMLDRAVRYQIQKTDPQYPFEKISSFLKGHDMVLSNLEGGFTDFAGKPLKDRTMQFTFDPKIVPHLKELGFTHFSQANNHSQDYGKKGFRQTQKYLKESGLNHFGAYYNDTDISHVEVVRNEKIAFVGYHQLTEENYDLVIKEIQTLRPNVDNVVAVAHWGYEYKRISNSRQRKEAREMIDAGADIVIGHHPHVIQEMEIYEGKPIFYSLGNFIFDQWWSKDTMEGFSVGVVFDKEETELHLFPMKIGRDLQSKLMSKKDADRILKWLSENSRVSEEMAKEIEKGIVRIPLNYKEKSFFRREK